MRHPRVRRVVYATIVAALLGASPAEAQTPAPAQRLLPGTPTVDRLENGLTVLMLRMPTPGVAAYFTLVRTGSRDEIEAGHSGFAHLFEHMMFRGTRELPSAEYEHRMQLLGADNNAFTTEDFTLYTVTLASNALPELVPIEADRFQHLYYSRPDFQTETRAVLGEYNRNASNPLTPMWEVLSEMAFRRHTYGHTTLGYLRDIEAMPGYYDYSRDFFQRFYTPDNCTVMLVGDVDRDALLPTLRQSYGPWRGHRAQPVIPVEPEQTEARRVTLAWPGSSPQRLLLGYRIPAFSLANSDAVALQVVHALAFSESSELYQRLVVREQKLLSLESWRGDFHRDPSLFTVEARLTDSAHFEEIEQAIHAELARIAGGGVTAERFREVVSNLRYSMAMELQTPSKVAESIARFLQLTGEVDTVERYYAALQGVTQADVARVAGAFLTSARSTAVRLVAEAHAPPDARRLGAAARPRPRPAAPRPAPRPAGAH